MMWDDPKKTATIIVSKRKQNGDKVSSAPMKPESVKSEDGTPDGKHMAAQDMIAALHEKSPKKLREAMDNYMAMHQNEKQGDSEES